MLAQFSGTDRRLARHLSNAVTVQHITYYMVTVRGTRGPVVMGPYYQIGPGRLGQVPFFPESNLGLHLSFDLHLFEQVADFVPIFSEGAHTLVPSRCDLCGLVDSSSL
jgi:hypothetical protein